MDVKYMGCIYAHVLRVHDSNQYGWMYIGQADNLEKRWKQKENAYRDCTFIYREMLKYGWDAFEHIILEDDVPTNKLDEREMYWIDKYHTCRYDPEYKGGFNLSFGGSGVRGPKPALKGKVPKNIPMLTEMKYKMIICLNSGTWNNITFEKGQQWKGSLECSEYFNERSSWVKHRLYGEWDIVTGPVFSFVDDFSKYDLSEIEKKQQKRKENQRLSGKQLGKVHQTGSRIDYNIYCVETKQVFYKVSDCLKEFGLARATLNGHLVHPDIHKTAKGYHFKRIPKTTANS